MNDLALPEADASDDKIVAIWTSLHDSPHTRRAYNAEASRFRSFVDKSLRTVGYADVIAYRDALPGSLSSKRRAIAAVKSLMGFGHRIGALSFDVGSAVKGVKAPSRLAQRILTEDSVQSIIERAEGRERVLLRVLYYAGLRVSELTALTWADLPARGFVVVSLGKGGKTRTIRIPNDLWDDVAALRGDALADAPVFAGRKGPMDTSSVFLIVRKHAAKAGVAGAVSPHWFRHSHASHSLERGATLAEVRDTLGHGSIATTSTYLHARPDRSSGLRLL